MFIPVWLLVVVGVVVAWHWRRMLRDALEIPLSLLRGLVEAAWGLRVVLGVLAGLVLLALALFGGGFWLLSWMRSTGDWRVMLGVVAPLAILSVVLELRHRKDRRTTGRSVSSPQSEPSASTPHP